MPESSVLGFDFGERRIGVAVGDRLLGIAHPLCTIDTEVTADWRVETRNPGGRTADPC
jgi:RNase H-fold protein (predicted Holliday junction resolvase)